MHTIQTHTHTHTVIIQKHVRKPDIWTHRHARPGQIHNYVKLLMTNPSIFVTVIMEMMSPRLWSSITFMSEKCSPTYVNVNAKHSHQWWRKFTESGGGILLQKMAKIKILWNILKMMWGCSPIVPPLPLPMTHIHSCINHCLHTLHSIQIPVCKI